MAGIKISLSIDTSIKPIQQPLRRVPVAVEDKVEAKLNEALALDVIEPAVGPSAWISPVVVVFKENGDIRLCIDMRRANWVNFKGKLSPANFPQFHDEIAGSKILFKA